jgi:phosphate acetyltransferase
MRDIVAEIKSRAQALNHTIILPETWDPRTLHAAAQVAAEGFAPVMLIGKKDEVTNLANEEAVSLDAVQIVDPDAAVKDYGLVDKLVELRKHKGMTPDAAAETLQNYLYVAAMLVKEGLAHGYVAGAANATANVIRSALQVLKTKPGIRTLSSCFLMVVPDCEHGIDGMFIYADCGVVPNPSAAQLADIAIISAQTCRNLTGAEPIVAMLSFSTKGSAKHALLDKVIEATAIVKERAPELVVDGEMQADAAIIPAVGSMKAPGSPAAGKANVLIFPDLNSGNICYKLTERLAKAGAYGPLIQGCSRPVNDLSRGCTADEIATVTAITAVMD